MIGLGRGIRHTRHITRRTLHGTTPTPLPPPPPAPGFGRFIPASIPARLDAGRPHRLFDAHITPHPHGMLIKSIKSITTPLHPPAYQRPAPPPLPPHTAAAAVSATGLGLCPSAASCHPAAEALIPFQAMYLRWAPRKASRKVAVSPVASSSGSP